MKNIYKKIIIKISILMLFVLAFSNYSYANNELSLNNAPRKSFTVDSDKFADVTVTIKDGNGINSVRLYSVDSEWKNAKKINFSSSNTSDNKMHIYTLSHKNLLKGKTKCFYIKITDGSGNIQYSRFRVSARTKTVNKKKIKYYAIDDAPRVKGFNVSGNKMSFIVRDAGGSKYAKILDLNNNNKQIDYFTNLKKGDATVQINISKYKAVNGRYKLKIITEDRYEVKATRTISFKLNSNSKPREETKEIEVTGVKINKTKLDMKEKDEQKLTATVQPENATNKTVTWSSSNTKVATVDKNGKVKAISNGTAVITATAVNGKTTTCKVTVSKVELEIKSDAEEWLKTCEDMAKKLNGKFRYYNYKSNPQSYQAAMKNKNYRCNCAEYVSYCLQEYGILKEGQSFYSNSNGNMVFKSTAKRNTTSKNLKKYANVITVNKRLKDYYDKLQPGDICCYAKHVNIFVGQDSNGSLIWDDAGPSATENKRVGSKFKKIQNRKRSSYSKTSNKVIKKIIRIDFSKVK